jgi:hypothetical protein
VEGQEQGGAKPEAAGESGQRAGLAQA